VELKKDIYKHYEEEKWLKSEIPEKIVVSMFEIDCWDMREALSGKHRKIAEEEIEIIAKTAWNQTNKLLKRFKEWHDIIEKSPQNIEELNEIWEFMTKVPIEIKKIKSEMERAQDVYETLNEFAYKFKSDDDFELKWKLFGSPKETFEKAEYQTKQLEKDQEKFVNQMMT